MPPLAIQTTSALHEPVANHSATQASQLDATQLEGALQDLNDFLSKLDGPPPPAIHSALRSLAARAQTLLINRQQFFLSDERFASEEKALLMGLATVRVTLSEIMRPLVPFQLLEREEKKEETDCREA
ncbi:hypothetical protein BCR35DRAFT_310929 [Leucosporidium creatinivorum]|uniref:Uncharacterized protein n=1 Tax=Leucosporidium creatinivorum TaxID=106004 RepID=A0A1Y2CKP1_9BASI|nr:hypothetical protein BCR35DRAFT_310929 [Leucosporidium creatinivorum]